MAKHVVKERNGRYFVMKRGRVVASFDDETEAKESATWLDTEREAWKASDEAKAEAGPDGPPQGDPPPPPKNEPPKEDPPKDEDKPKKSRWGNYAL